MKASTLLGTALAALGVTAASLLAPQKAAALSFKFSFPGVSGLISGLADNTPDQLCSLPPSTCKVEVLSNSIGAPLGEYLYYLGNGFTTLDGSITQAGFFGVNFSSPASGLVLVGFESFFEGAMFNSQADTFGQAEFTPAVPGPLPLFGAAAAFGYSRKLRKRLKGSSNTGTTAPLF